MKILDRYVLQKFLLPFFYCFLGFLAIWLIVDLSDNLPDFLQGKVGLAVLLGYYRSQIPEIVVLSLPISALLALLYSLTAMSRSNEIISMLGAGLSVIRIITPLLVMGMILVGVTTYFSFESAPRAALLKKQILKEIKRGKSVDMTRIQGHLYPNREDRRIWFMREVIASENRARDLQIFQMNEDGEIVAQWYARDANYDPATKEWSFWRGRYTTLDPTGNTLASEDFEKRVVSDWRETPWRISSSVMNPDFLSVPELRDYLEFNSDFPEVRLAAYRTKLNDRWAIPWASMIAILLAAPMGIVYSRRGILGSVAVAIGLFSTLFFANIIFVSLGKANWLSPAFAAWGPFVFFFLIGCLLIWYRSTNRDLPKLRLPWLS